MADSPVPTPSPPPRFEKQPTAGYSPTPGCIIFAIGGLAILFLVTWFFYAGYKQAKELESFTSSDPVKFVLPVVSEQERSDLTARLTAYAAAVEGQKAAELSLNVAEINALLAVEPTLESVRQNLQLQSIDTRMIAKISFPLNALSGGNRFLNGMIEFTPVIKSKTGLAVQTETISVPGHAVSEGFVRLYREMNFLDDMLLKAFREHPTLGPPFQQTTSVILRDGGVVVSYKPAAG